MIDQNKLEESFKMIGTKRIPHYIDLFLNKNKEFPTKLVKYHKKKEYDNLINLLHKTRGSISIFHPNHITNVFIDAEDLLANNPQDFTGDTIDILTTTYKNFCEELSELKLKYAKISSSP